MNEQINAQALPLLGALAKLNELGVKVISVRLDSIEYHPEIHLGGNFDPNIFKSPITTDHGWSDRHIYHNCLFESVVLFWLEEKEEVTA